jgi:hypothetical protein
MTEQTIVPLMRNLYRLQSHEGHGARGWVAEAHSYTSHCKSTRAPPPPTGEAQLQQVGHGLNRVMQLRIKDCRQGRTMSDRESLLYSHLV